MNLVHVHLMLNHVPVLGVLFGTTLLAIGLWRGSDELKRLALGMLVIAALVAIPVYLTGEPAEDRVEGLPGVSHSTIEQHEEAALIAFASLIALGSIALTGLLWTWRKAFVPGWLTSILLSAAVVVCLFAAWTANLGGKVRHSEIRADARIQATGAETDDD